MRVYQAALLLSATMFTAVGCTSDHIAAPSEVSSRSANIQLSQISDALSAQRRMLVVLEQMRGTNKLPSVVDHITQANALIVRLTRDSLALAGRLEESSDTPASFHAYSAMFDLGGDPIDDGGDPSGAVIDDTQSYTWFILPTPQLWVQTVPLIGALYLRQRTSGSYTKFDQTYPIISTKDLGAYTRDNTDFPIFYWVLNDYVPLQIDCSRFGVEAHAVTEHYASWFFADVGFLSQSMTTSGQDDGQCPHVAPTPHFQMTSGGRFGSDRSPLYIPSSATVGLSADGTERDKPIVSYQWYVNGTPTERNYYSTVYAAGLSTGIRLTVTDALGKSASADGAIFLTPPPSDDPPEGGSGPHEDPDEPPYTPPPATPPLTGTVCDTQFMEQWDEVNQVWTPLGEETVCTSY